MALGLDEVAWRDSARLRSPPNRHVAKHGIAEVAGRDRRARPRDRFGVAVVEVDREERAPIGGEGEQFVGLGEVEHERLLDEEVGPELEELARRSEVPLVGQAHAHKIRAGLVEHPREVGERGTAYSAARVAARSGSRPAIATTSVSGRAGEDAGVLSTPDPGADDRDAQKRIRHAASR